MTVTGNSHLQSAAESKPVQLITGEASASRLGATWKVACVSVSVSDHKETMKPAIRELSVNRYTCLTHKPYYLTEGSRFISPLTLFSPTHASVSKKHKLSKVGAFENEEIIGYRTAYFIPSTRACWICLNNGLVRAAAISLNSLCLGHDID
jgi:hypothetical protein